MLLALRAERTAGDTRDLLILAGPTMDIAGPQAVYRLRSPEDLPDDRLTELDGSRLQCLSTSPLGSAGDKAEGLCHYDAPEAQGLLVVYDAPRSERLIGDDAVLADVFSLSAC